MESTIELSKSSLARRLGDIAHVSPLLRKICHLSGCSENRVTEWLLKCAVDRGTSHYERPFANDLPPDNPELTNEEVAVGLCLGQHPYNSVFIRAAAQLLSSSQTAAPRLARLAVMERVEPVLFHNAMAHYNLAITLRRLGRETEARHHFGEADRIRGDSLPSKNPP